MAIDWTADLLRPNYAEFGAAAVLLLDPDLSFDLVAMDLTAGASVGGPVMVETQLPMARVIARDLAELGILVSQLDGATLLLNDRSWVITAHQVQPTTGGEGEVQLILEAAG